MGRVRWWRDTWEPGVWEVSRTIGRGEGVAMPTSAGLSASSLFHVAFPTMPSAISPLSAWNRLTYDSVPEPKMPSASQG